MLNHIWLIAEYYLLALLSDLETYRNQVRLGLRQVQLSSNHIAFLNYRTSNITTQLWGPDTTPKTYLTADLGLRPSSLQRWVQYPMWVLPSYL